MACAPDVFRLHCNFFIDQFLTPLLFMLPFISRIQCMFSLSFDFLQIAENSIESTATVNMFIFMHILHHYHLLSSKTYLKSESNRSYESCSLVKFVSVVLIFAAFSAISCNSCSCAFLKSTNLC